jgi:hypothetical protein
MSYLLDLYYQDFSRSLAEREKKAKEGSIWIKRIQSRYESDTNSDVAVTGERGVGKSTLALRGAELLAPSWYIDKPEEAVDRFVTFTTAEFGRAVKTMPERGLVVLIGDEWGQQMHHREFMTTANVALSSMLQGYRYKRPVTFLNLPGVRFLDADSEGLLTFQAHLEHRGEAEIYRISHPKFKGDDFHHKMVDSWRFGPPGERLWKAYLVKKFANQDRVIDRAIKIAEDAEQTRITNSEAVDVIVADPKAFLQANGKELDANLISGLGVNINRAYAIRAIAAKKLGLQLKPEERPEADLKVSEKDSAEDLLRGLNR